MQFLKSLESGGSFCTFKRYQNSKTRHSRFEWNSGVLALSTVFLGILATSEISHVSILKMKKDISNFHWTDFRPIWGCSIPGIGSWSGSSDINRFSTENCRYLSFSKFLLWVGHMSPADHGGWVIIQNLFILWLTTSIGLHWKKSDLLWSFLWFMLAIHYFA